jgi:signal peptidase I
MKEEIIAEIISWVKMIFIAVFVSLVMNYLVLVNATVPSASMEKTIMVNDRIMAYRHSYAFKEPKRLEIIIFKFPDDLEIGKTTLFVKRIIGLPGETVDIIDGKIYINGSETPLDEPYIKEAMAPQINEHFEVPEKSYFMLGDNRNNSLDSRAWKNKFVHSDTIVGKLWFRYFKGFRIY